MLGLDKARLGQSEEIFICYVKEILYVMLKNV